jgi:hypothetical protein
MTRCGFGFAGVALPDRLGQAPALRQAPRGVRLARRLGVAQAGREAGDGLVVAEGGGLP